MKKIVNIWWPDDVGERWRHSMKHVGSLEFALSRCKRKRTAVQAGGNIGLWPRRMAQAGFDRVITFEPDDVSRACLERNVPDEVIVRPQALGAVPGRCAIDHKSLGSHRVVAGDDVEVVTVDGLELDDLDLLQLDLEGYEWHALAGAQATLDRCRPLVQVELRNFTSKYGMADADVHSILKKHGYRQVSAQPGNDFVFAPC